VIILENNEEKKHEHHEPHQEHHQEHHHEPIHHEKKHDEHNEPKHHEEHNINKSHALKNRVLKKVKKIRTQRNVFIALSAVLAIALLLALFVFNNPVSTTTSENVTNDDISNNIIETTTALTMTIINDGRCGPNCDTTGLIANLQGMFPDIEVIELDYSEDKAKEILTATKIQFLPAVLFSGDIESERNYQEVARFLSPFGDYQILPIGATYDPEGEICDNGIDDDGDELVDCDDDYCSDLLICNEICTNGVDDDDDGLVDCDDDYCDNEWSCALEKTDKPVVELFVMSHCPYGTQIEKGILPVLDTLGDKIDFELKFCNYAMHGQVELNEELNQVCIQENYPDELNTYLYCFLEDGDTERCVEKLEFDQDTLDACIVEKDTEYKVTELFEDKTTWINGNYPQFNVFGDDVAKYGVQGSPAFVLNGVSVPTGRSSPQLLETICAAFIDAPEECDTVLEAINPSPGFGFEAGSAAANAAAQCG
jgi:hypothetical protein